MMVFSVPESHILAMVENTFDLILSPKSYETTRPTSQYINLNPCIANEM